MWSRSLAAAILVGPSDWEAEGRGSRTAHGAVPHSRSIARGHHRSTPASHASPPCHCCDASDQHAPRARVSLEQRARSARHAAGRLPTEDEWLAAAGGDKPRRYPMGRHRRGLPAGRLGPRVGTVRRRGGRARTPVGAHPDGATPLGIHDLAGNVAEWVEAPCSESRRTPARLPRRSRRVVETRAGDGAPDLASAGRLGVRHGGGDPTIGFRCAYDRP